MNELQHLWVFWVRVQRFKGCAILAQQVINYSLGNGKKNENQRRRKMRRLKINI